MLIKERARGLRKEPTEAEKKLWSMLRNRHIDGLKFYRQFPILPYYVDFCCRDIDLVIEADGGQHDESEYDKRRTRFLEEKGYTVLRFWNNDILGNIDGVMVRIMEASQALTPALSLKGEREEYESSP